MPMKKLYLSFFLMGISFSLFAQNKQIGSQTFTLKSGEWFKLASGGNPHKIDNATRTLPIQMQQK